MWLSEKEEEPLAARLGLAALRPPHRPLLASCARFGPPACAIAELTLEPTTALLRSDAASPSSLSLARSRPSFGVQLSGPRLRLLPPVLVSRTEDAGRAPLCRPSERHPLRSPVRLLAHSAVHSLLSCLLLRASRGLLWSSLCRADTPAAGAPMALPVARFALLVDKLDESAEWSKVVPGASRTWSSAAQIGGACLSQPFHERAQLMQHSRHSLQRRVGAAQTRHRARRHPRQRLPRQQRRALLDDADLEDRPRAGVHEIRRRCVSFLLAALKRSLLTVPFPRHAAQDLWVERSSSAEYPNFKRAVAEAQWQLTGKDCGPEGQLHVSFHAVAQGAHRSLLLSQLARAGAEAPLLVTQSPKRTPNGEIASEPTSSLTRATTRGTCSPRPPLPTLFRHTRPHSHRLTSPRRRPRPRRTRRRRQPASPHEFSLSSSGKTQASSSEAKGSRTRRSRSISVRLQELPRHVFLSLEPAH